MSSERSRAALSARKVNEFTRAKENLSEAEKLTDRQRDPAEWADVQFRIADILLQQRQPGEAQERLENVIEVRIVIFGPEHRETLNARRLLGHLFIKAGRKHYGSRAGVL